MILMAMNAFISSEFVACQRRSEGTFASTSAPATPAAGGVLVAAFSLVAAARWLKKSSPKIWQKKLIGGVLASRGVVGPCCSPPQRSPLARSRHLIQTHSTANIIMQHK